MEGSHATPATASRPATPSAPVSRRWARDWRLHETTARLRAGRGERSTEAQRRRAERRDHVLLDLRTQLQTIAASPPLPAAWHFETATATAGGARFGGDVTVPVYDREGCRLEVVTVDVSGKGLAAGTRALLLTGAISALMGVLPPAELMAALNRHILRQEWLDGFATAVHVGLDFTTGEYSVTGAGHPPVVHFHAGSGRWTVLEQGGTLLGVLDDGTWPVLTGQLLPGDVLLSYTDGLIERRGEALSYGIDRLLGAAEHWVLRDFIGGAAGLIGTVAATGDDDRNVTILRRHA